MTQQSHRHPALGGFSPLPVDIQIDIWSRSLISKIVCFKLSFPLGKSGKKISILNDVRAGQGRTKAMATADLLLNNKPERNKTLI